MSKVPDIMRTIAKRAIRSGQSIKTSSKILDNQSGVQQENYESFQQPQQKGKKEKTEFQQQGDQSQTNNNESIDELEKQVMQYFICMQKRKLKLLYPTLNAKQIQTIAEQVWNDITIAQKQVYTKKWAQQKQILPLPEVSDEQSSSHHTEKDNSNTQTKNEQTNLISNMNQIIETHSSNIQQVERQQHTNSSALLASQGISNDETKASLLNHEQNHLSTLTEVYTLISCEHSQMKYEKEAVQIQINNNKLNHQEKQADQVVINQEINSDQIQESSKSKQEQNK